MPTTGRIDVLVNDIWGGELLKGGPPAWNKPIWETDLDDGLRILRLGIDTHLITAHALLPLVVAAPGGLLVEVTDGTRDYNADHYRISVFYDLVKTAVNRLAWSFGHELGPHGATAVAVTPGWLRSEMMLEAFGVTEDRWREADAPDGLRASPSRPGSWAEASRPSPPIPSGRGGTSGPSPPRTWPPSTGSPISTAPSPTRGR